MNHWVNCFGKEIGMVKYNWCVRYIDRELNRQGYVSKLLWDSHFSQSHFSSESSFFQWIIYNGSGLYLVVHRSKRILFCCSKLVLEKSKGSNGGVQRSIWYWVLFDTYHAEFHPSISDIHSINYIKITFLRLLTPLVK